MSIRRVSVFLPRDTEFYRGLLPQILRGFTAAGVEATGALGHPGAAAMREHCALHRPDLVFEMNRPRRDAEFVPAGIAHVCWVVDFNGRPLTYFEGSEATYLFGESWVRHYPHAGFHAWMGPGACEHDYAVTPHVPTFDTSFAGHMPNPWSEAELARDLTGRGACSFGELLPEIEQLLRTLPVDRSPDDLLGAVDQACRARSGHPLLPDDVLRYDICGRTVRHVNRTDLVDAALAQTQRLALYGPVNWSRWPHYAAHYRGWLGEPAAMRRAYGESATNLHEGTGIHFRSMDVMCSGGVVLWRTTPHDHLHGGIAEQFEAGVHYVPFELGNLGERLGELLDDPARAARIRVAAAAAIRAGHTWRHRAQTILRDVAAL
ncbi:MAG: glycosyltransferase family 1 protein [Deltaproteobacteria bacterium]|nr:glycosyltransferase family 1 protein [Nannocystaceae bacterium]